MIVKVQESAETTVKCACKTGRAVNMHRNRETARKRNIAGIAAISRNRNMTGDGVLLWVVARSMPSNKSMSDDPRRYEYEYECHCEYEYGHKLSITVCISEITAS